MEFSPLHELSVRPGCYTFTDARLPDETAILHPPGELVAAVGVVLTPVKNEQLGSLGLSHEVLPSVYEAPDQAVDGLMEAHQRLMTPLQQNPLSDALAQFKSQAIEDAGMPFYREGHLLMGGLAVYSSEEGYNAGVFVSRKLTSSIKWQAGTLDTMRNEYYRHYRQPPQDLVDMVDQLPVRDQQRYPRIIDRVLKSIISDALPGHDQLRREITPDREPAAEMMPPEIEQAALVAA